MFVSIVHCLVPGKLACVIEDVGGIEALLNLYIVDLKPTSCGNQEFGTGRDGLSQFAQMVST